uniref:Uncharacterized protein n=1 Tax=mine drainage metagenome TaxID=410659 RepID=E6QHB0_9ZZZZ
MAIVKTQYGDLSPSKGTGSAFGRALRESMAARAVSTKKIAEAYRDLLVRDRKLNRDRRRFDTDYYKLTGLKSDSLPTRLFARWYHDENPSKPTAAVAWRVFEALARLGVPVTGLDGLIAAEYRGETIALIGTILGRWQKDRWFDQPDSIAVKRGLGLAAARSVGFVRLVERLTPQQELISTLAIETGCDTRDIWSALTYRNISGASFGISDAVASLIDKRRREWVADLKLRPGFKNVHALIAPNENCGSALLSLQHQSQIAKQEQDNKESMRALVACRDQLTNAWWKWRERERSLQDALPEYVVAYHALGLNTVVGCRVAQDVLVNDEFAFGVEKVQTLLGRQIIDPDFPRFSRILWQMREFSGYGNSASNEALAG